MNELKQWFWGVLISIDQFFNALLFPILNRTFNVSRLDPFGNPDETLSSVFGKNLDRCAKCRWVCKWLGWIDKKHCRESIEFDE